MVESISGSARATAALHARPQNIKAAHGARPLPNLQQLLSDLAEEASFSVGESEDYDESDLDRVEDGERARREHLVRQVKELEGKYLDAYGDAEETFRAALKRHEHNREGQARLLQGGGDSKTDASLHWLLLQKVAADGTLAAALGSPAAAETFLAQWIKSNGASVQAGANVLAAARAAQPNLAQPLEAVQGFYQKEVAAMTCVVGVLASMAREFGVARFDAARHFIAQSLAADFSAARPSQDKVRLANILDELQGIKILNTLRWKLDAVREHFATAPVPSSDALLGAFLQYLAKPLEHLPNLESQCQHASGEKRVVFLQGLLGGVRALAPPLFANTDARTRALAALQQKIDHLILEEGY